MNLCIHILQVCYVTFVVCLECFTLRTAHSRIALLKRVIRSLSCCVVDVHGGAPCTTTTMRWWLGLLCSATYNEPKCKTRINDIHINICYAYTSSGVTNNPNDQILFGYHANRFLFVNHTYDSYRWITKCQVSYIYITKYVDRLLFPDGYESSWARYVFVLNVWFYLSVEWHTHSRRFWRCWNKVTKCSNRINYVRLLLGMHLCIWMYSSHKTYSAASLCGAIFENIRGLRNKLVKNRSWCLGQIISNIIGPNPFDLNKPLTNKKTYWRLH